MNSHGTQMALLSRNTIDLILLNNKYESLSYLYGGIKLIIVHDVTLTCNVLWSCEYSLIVVVNNLPKYKILVWSESEYIFFVTNQLEDDFLVVDL